MPDAEHDDVPWQVGVYDAHCHPTDSMSCIEEIPNMQAEALTIMATRSQDQDLVSQVAEQVGLFSSSAEGSSEVRRCKVVPSFGWHPWFSHQLYDDVYDPAKNPPSKKDHYASVLSPSLADGAFLHALPEPRSLASFIRQTRGYLERYPLALVGEIGLDKTFRIPDLLQPEQPAEHEPEQTAGSRQGRRLSPYRVDVQHLTRVLKGQLDLAAEMGRAISVHGVSAHGVLFEALQSTWKGHEKPVVSHRTRKRRMSVTAAHVHEEGSESGDNGSSESGVGERKPYPPRICLHSYSGPPEPLKQYLHPAVPATIFFSFSEVINFSTAAASRAVEVIKALPADRILIESDLHRAGPGMDEKLEGMARKVCEIKQWPLAEGLGHLARNWQQFVLGSAG